MKMHKNCCHQSCSFWLRYAPNRLLAGASPPDHTGGAYSAPPDSLAGLGGGVPGEGKEEGGKEGGGGGRGGRGRKGREGKRVEERGGLTVVFGGLQLSSAGTDARYAASKSAVTLH